MRVTDELDRLILTAVGDDFATMEFIVGKLCGTPGEITGKLDAGHLYRRLFELVADKLVSAYLLHAEPPYITPVELSSDAFPACWFYITQRGRKCLANSARKHAPLQHNKDLGPERSEYSSAVNF